MTTPISSTGVILTGTITVTIPTSGVTSNSGGVSFPANTFRGTGPGGNAANQTGAGLLVVPLVYRPTPSVDDGVWPSQFTARC